MKTKPVTPYQRLLADIKEFCDKLECRHTKIMWMYPKEKLNQGWALDTLYERVQAADQLGYDVVLKAIPDGLNVTYVKRIPDVPYEWQ